jgi:hypothetical protein
MCSGNLWPLLARSLAALQSGGAIPLTPWLYPLQSGSVWLPHGTGMTPLHSSPIGLDWRHWGHARLASRDRASRVTGQGLGLTPGRSVVQCRSRVEPIECRLCDWVAFKFCARELACRGVVLPNSVAPFWRFQTTKTRLSR